LNILLITDSYNKVSGITNFINLFYNYLSSNNNTVKLLFFSNTDCKVSIDLKLEFDYIYINAHFSNIDKYFIKKGRNGLENLLNINLTKTKIIIISHGWNKMRYNFSFYYFYYFIKSYNSNLNRIYEYDSIIFINNTIDNFRHLDFKFVLKNQINNLYFNFSEYYIQNLRNNHDIIFKKNNGKIKILVISNPDFVKNLEILIILSLKNYLNKNKREFYLLSIRPKNLYFKALYYLLNLFKINIFYNQNDKFFLLNECSYLFIPSHTEYLPLVSLEAFSFNKHVISLNKISSLCKYKFYHYIKKSNYI
jgi:hypothetical protein